MLDLRHGLQFVGGGRVNGGDDPAVCGDADLIVVTAGAAHGPGETRLDLAGVNAGLVRRRCRRCSSVAPDAIVLLVTNPVDVVTFVAQEISGLPPGRVIGSGTVLDTSRLRHLLAERLGVAVNSVHATVVGEHGDSEIVLWSTASVGGTPLLDAVGPDGGRVDRRRARRGRHEVRTAAAQIIAGKGNTNLAIGLATARIVRAIAHDEHAVLPVSVRADRRRRRRGVPVAAQRRRPGRHPVAPHAADGRRRAGRLAGQRGHAARGAGRGHVAGLGRCSGGDPAWASGRPRTLGAVDVATGR